MNKILQKHARDYIINGLKQCTQGQINKFRTMYAPGDNRMPIESIVENMGPEQLDWAMRQIENTLNEKEMESR